ncbi:MAG: Xaa-Pro aminopeptidase [Ignavibacteriales bacterium CG_4_9_14_3_um_filter_34_10]|nr:MAG: Xaa-Pro aminopeptidase [Ignavibacteriales bacterium CG_4_9_14_3_um_filter_34_10]
MFPAKTYINRREELRKKIKNGIILLPGNTETAINYPSNTYYFRQDSSFLYYLGIDKPNLAGVIDVDDNQDILFGNDREIDDIVWMGTEESIADSARKVGVDSVKSFDKLMVILSEAIAKGKKIHFLPQYRAENSLLISTLTGINPFEINKQVSEDLIRAVISQRIIKSDEEVNEIEKALNVSYEMNTIAMKFTKPGMMEKEIYGLIQGIVLGASAGNSFQPIFSVHGETLHNHSYNNIMESGKLAVLDSGAESELHYASDITRTFPVNGKFSEQQKNIYNVVLNAQLKAIEMMKPGIPYKEVHLNAAKEITIGLQSVGLMKGNVDESVANGAHALFFPHGLGHLLGLDVHDLEGLGENFIGYDKNVKRSEQFGLGYLRFAKPLETGHVITVEPGIYFIPQLIDMWKSEKKFESFIDYAEVSKYLDFGGIRIEDDVLITDTGHRVLGQPIPKTIEEVETVFLTNKPNEIK